MTADRPAPGLTSFIALSAAAVLACAGMSLLLWNRPELLVSSDSLLPAAFVRDLAQPAHVWLGFQQARVPSFFPDLLVFGPAQLALGWRAAMAIWSFAVMAGLACAASWIVAKIARVRAETATLSTLTVFMAILTAGVRNVPWLDSETGGQNPFLPYLGAAMPYAHGGPFVVSLAAAAFAMRAAEQPGYRSAAALFVVSMALGLSDLLCVTSLLVPLTAALSGRWLAGAGAWRAIVWLATASWSGAAVGWAASLFLERQPLPMPSTQALRDQIAHFLADLPQYPGLAIATGVLGVVLAYDVWRLGPRAWFGGGWHVFAATASAGSLAAAAVNYQDIFSSRYALPLYWWTAILIAAALARSGGPCPWLPRVTAAFALAGIALTQTISGWGIPKVLIWDTPLAACVKDAGARAGLADYWNARAMAAASDWTIQADQITATGQPHIWGNNPYWYTHDQRDVSRPPPYGFVVMERLSPGHIVMAFGPPDRIVPCGTIPVWYYGDSSTLSQPMTDAVMAQAARAASMPPGWRVRIIRFVSRLFQ